MNRTTVQLISNEGPAWEHAKRIRVEVFVHEQHVPAEEELDEYEDSSRHFLAEVDGQPAGACRWRYTDKGVKLERFAVLAAFRGHGVGSALVRAALADVAAQPASEGKTRYLHAQVGALFLYERHGFVKTGEPFDECGIMHYRMHLPQ